MSLPDVEMIILAELRAQFSSVTFGTQIPADLTERLPYAMVKRVPGSRMHPTLASRGLVDVSVWGDDRLRSRDLAVDIQRHIETVATAWSFAECTTEPFEIRPNVFQEGAQLPQDLYRFQATYRLVVRAS